MGAEVRVIDSSGAWGEILPDWSDLTFSQDLIGPGALTFQYPREGRNAEWLKHGQQLAILLDDFEPVGGRFTYFEDNGANIPGSAEMKTYNCMSNMRRTERLLLAPSVGSVVADENAFAYTNRTPGYLVTTALANAFSRVTPFGSASTLVPWLTHPVPVLSDAVDSSGFTWPTTYDVTFPPTSTSVWTVLEWLRENGFAEAYMDGRNLRVLHPSRNGVDRSADPGQIVIQTGKDLTENNISSSSVELVNSLLVTGDNNSMAWVQDAASIAQWGYREGVLSVSNASTQATLIAAGQAYLSICKDPRYSYTYAVGAKYLEDASLKRPFIDYRVGDKVLVFDGPTPRVERIRLLSATWPTSSNASVQISVNDWFADQAEEFERRLKRLGG